MCLSAFQRKHSRSNATILRTTIGCSRWMSVNEEAPLLRRPCYGRTWMVQAQMSAFHASTSISIWSKTFTNSASTGLQIAGTINNMQLFKCPKRTDVWTSPSVKSRLNSIMSISPPICFFRRPTKSRISCWEIRRQKTSSASKLHRTLATLWTKIFQGSHQWDTVNSLSISTIIILSIMSLK